VDSLSKEIANKKTNQFFYCPSCKMVYSSEQALLDHYSCPECGEVLQLKDNTLDVQEMEKQLYKLQKILEEINSELLVIGQEEEKAKGRRMKADAKKKEKERAIRKKEKTRLEKKLGKVKGKAKKGKKSR
jgi:predicted RNA-binding Zn-ribbon protein involved in translation (DUF1610 family)